MRWRWCAGVSWSPMPGWRPGRTGWRGDWAGWGGGRRRGGGCGCRGGATGAHKGVAVTHGGLANYVVWAAGEYGPGSGGAVLHSSLAFDLTVTSVVVPLVAGSVVVASVEGGAEALAGLAGARGGFDVVKVVPGHLPLLAALISD